MEELREKALVVLSLTGRSGYACCAGVVGIALALAGADVTLTDLSHVTPLTRENVAANCQSPLVRAEVCYAFCTHIVSSECGLKTRRSWGASAANNGGMCFHQVVDYAWSEDVDALPGAPDIITGADVVYQQEHFAALLKTLQRLAAPHTLIYLAFRLRGAVPPQATVVC
jgi:predicted nicotinamide N-methyase